MCSDQVYPRDKIAKVNLHLNTVAPHPLPLQCIFPIKMTVLLDGSRFCSVTTITQLAAGGRTFILINSFISCHIHRYVIMFCECDHHYLLIMFSKYHTIFTIEFEMNDFIEMDLQQQAFYKRPVLSLVALKTTVYSPNYSRWFLN